MLVMRGAAVTVSARGAARQLEVEVANAPATRRSKLRVAASVPRYAARV